MDDIIFMCGRDIVQGEECYRIGHGFDCLSHTTSPELDSPHLYGANTLENHHGRSLLSGRLAPLLVGELYVLISDCLPSCVSSYLEGSCCEVLTNFLKNMS